LRRDVKRPTNYRQKENKYVQSYLIERFKVHLVLMVMFTVLMCVTYNFEFNVISDMCLHRNCQVVLHYYFIIYIHISVTSEFFYCFILPTVDISVISEFFYCFILPTVHITSELFYCFINSSLLLCRTCLLLFVLLIEFLPPNTGEVIMMLSTWPYSSNKKKLNHNKTRLKNVDSLLALG